MVQKKHKSMCFIIKTISNGLKHVRTFWKHAVTRLAMTACLVDENSNFATKKMRNEKGVENKEK